MITFLKNFLFSNKSVNSLERLALHALGQKISHNLAQVQNLYVFVYEPIIYQKVAKELQSYKNLDQIKILTTQDLTVDCVQLFLIADGDSSYIVSIFDPYDPYQKEYVMDVFKVNLGN